MVKKNKITFKKAKSEPEIKCISKLAKVIFTEVYNQIIPIEQVVVLIHDFQSLKKVTKHIKEDNYVYYIINYNKQPVGYFGLKFFEQKTLLSKIYLLREYRGKAIGKTTLDAIDNLTIERGINKIELLVNVNNRKAIDIYFRNGFEVKDTINTIIENGFLLKDYIMEKVLI